MYISVIAEIGKSAKNIMKNQIGHLEGIKA